MYKLFCFWRGLIAVLLFLTLPTPVIAATPSLPTPVFAATPSNESYSIVATFASYHLKRRGRNEFNPGLGLRYASDPYSEWGIGFYKNSFSTNSFAVTHSWLPLGSRYVRAGGFIGLVTGYPQSSVLPSAGLQVQFLVEKNRMNVGFIPPVKRAGLGGVFAFQFLRDF